MKKINLLLTLLASSFMAIAQAPQSPIHEGRVLVYNVFPEGGELQSELVLERVSPDTVIIGWSMPASMRSGRRTMIGSSLHTSKLGFWEPPFPGEDILIPADQSMLFMSKSVFAQAKATGRIQFDGLTFIATSSKGSIYQAGSLRLPAIELKTENGIASIWILDDPALPLMLKYTGNPSYVDIEIIGIR